MSAYLPYLYRCGDCSHEITQRPFSCSKCQITSVGHFKIESKSNEPVCVCQQCSAEERVALLPNECWECRTDNCGWWDTASQTWAGLNLAPAADRPTNSSWITGDFDGDYEGEPKILASEQADPAKNFRSYRIKITKGFLSNVEVVDGPPITLGSSEKRPFTYRVMHPVDIELSSKNNKVATAQTALRDFRLHDWTVVGSSESPSAFDSKILGRISGRAYGLFVLEDEKSSRPIIPTPSIVSEAVSPSLTTTSQSPSAQVADTAGAASTEPHPTGGETSPIRPLHKPCFICSILPNLILLLLITIQCRFWVALAYVLFISFVCWLDEQTTHRGLKIQTFQWRVVWGVAILILALLGIYEDRLPWLHNICQAYPTLSIALTALALLLSVRVYSCLLKCVLLTLFLIALNGWCHFDGTCQSTTEAELSQHTAQSLSGPVPSLTNTATPATATPTAPPPAAPTPAATQSPHNTSPSLWSQIHAAAGNVASTLSASFQGLPSRLSSLQALPSRLSAEINSLANTASAPSASLSLSSATQENSLLEAGHLVSLDDAIRNAKLLDDCRTRIYIPFDYSVATLGPAAQEKLSRLGDQLRAHQSGVYVLTGHSDTSGDETAEGYLMNIQLSGMRAEAVRSFLVNSGFLSAERLDVHSAGSSIPITNAPDSLYLNRRVELNLRCKANNKSQLGN